MKLDNFEIVIGVLNCPNYKYRAKGIRATWLRKIPANVKVFFVYARPGQDEILVDDRIYLNCQETYECLPEKVHRFFCFCKENFRFDYVLKTDDDSYIDMDGLMSFDPAGGDYVGLIEGFGDAEATRTWHYGKCSDKSLEVPYEGGYVCKWARGAGYLLSNKAVSILTEVTAHTYADHLFEDKMVGEALYPDERIASVYARYADIGIVNPMYPENISNLQKLLIRLGFFRFPQTCS